MKVGERIGISKAMLFAYRSGTSPISDKVWKKLSEAERAAGLMDYPERSTSGGRVEDPRPSAASAPFNQYLSMVRGLREEAEKLSAGDPARASQLFETLLRTWSESVANKRRGTAHPFGAADDAEIKKARQVIEQFETAEAEERARESQRRRSSEVG